VEAGSRRRQRPQAVAVSPGIFSKTQVTLDDLARVFRLTIDEAVSQLSPRFRTKIGTSTLCP
jgi:hypothetical protein